MLLITIVIPEFHGPQGLEQAVALACRAAHDLVGEEFEIVVALGRGASAPSTKALGARQVRVVQAGAGGYGAALAAGLRAARGGHVVIFDAEGHSDATVIGNLWAHRHTAELIVASRYVEGGAARMSPVRLVLSRALNLLFRRGLSVAVTDLTSGYRLVARSALSHILPQARGYSSLAEMVVRAHVAGYRVAEVPFVYRATGKAGLWRRLSSLAFDYLRTFVQLWRLRNSIASADYDDRAFDSPIWFQRAWQRTRYRILTDLCPTNGRVLDVGCGSARFLGYLPQAVGLDISAAKLRCARKHGKPLCQGDIAHLPFADAAFDAVVCSEVIEHVPQPAARRGMGELLRVLRPKGVLVLGTPDYGGWRWPVIEWLYRWVHRGGYADDHVTHFTRRDLEQWSRDNGLSIQATRHVAGAEVIMAFEKPEGGASLPPGP